MTGDGDAKFAARLSDIRNERRELAVRISFAVVAVVIAIMVLYLTAELPDKEYSSYASLRPVIRMSAAGALVFVLGIATYWYVVGDLKKLGVAHQSDDSQLNFDELAIMVSAIETVAKEMKENRVLSEEDFRSITERINEKVNKEISETFIKNIDDEYGNSIISKRVSGRLKELGASINKRFEIAQGDVRRKTSVSLVYGILIAILGILILGYFVLNPKSVSELNTSVYFEISYYASKLLLVMLIEGIAFFFFKIYRASLQEEIGLVRLATKYEVLIASAQAACMQVNDKLQSTAFEALFGQNLSQIVVDDGVNYSGGLDIKEISAVAEGLAKVSSELKGLLK